MIRVVSWNIEHGRQIDQAISEMKRTPQLAGADIVLVQEMSPESATQLAKGLDMDHRYGAVADSCVTGLPFGNAVLSRWPLTDSEIIPLPGVALINPQPRCAVYATVTVDGTPVAAVSAHLETAYMRRAGRTTQTRTIAEHRLANQAMLTVVGGDFNSASGLAVMGSDRAMAAAGLARATDSTTPTFRRFGLNFTLDHLYARGQQSRSLAITDSGVVTTATASDHLPIWAEIPRSEAH